jgi:translation initiation factor 3 subunit A
MGSRFRGGNFARPENALKRADELENVGQKLSALQQLHDVVTSKKHRTWSKTYEEIMFKLLDLCVEMKKRNQAKEALMQYRNMCQQVNINSLEEVIKYYLNKATEMAEKARQQAEVSCYGITTMIRLKHRQKQPNLAERFCNDQGGTGQ